MIDSAHAVRSLHAKQARFEVASRELSRAMPADVVVTASTSVRARSTASRAVAAARRGRWRRWAAPLGFVAALAAVALDQLTKVWAEAVLVLGERHPLLADLLAIQLAYNPGAAFSLGAGATPVITIAAIAGSALAAWLTWRATSPLWAVGLGLILGGALGNVIDRLARAPGLGRGHVVDFIAYADWFIGNVADIFVFAGMVVCIALGLTGVPMRHEDASRQPS